MLSPRMGGLLCTPEAVALLLQHGADAKAHDKSGDLLPITPEKTSIYKNLMSSGDSTKPRMNSDNLMEMVAVGLWSR